MAEILLEPSSLSKIIPLSFDLNDTNSSNAAQLMTKRQFNTADTDAWFQISLEGFVDTAGSFDITLFNLNDKSVFNHTGKPFTTSQFYYKLDSESDETTNEIRHAGRWIGQIVVTLANGNSATRKFIFDIEGHILDGADVQTILLEDYNALIALINTSKDLLTQYNVDYAALLVDLAAAETARTNTYNQLVADQQANIDAFDVALDTGIVAANLATKLQTFEATNNSRLLSAEQQLAQTNAQVDLLNRGLGETISSLALLNSTYPTGDTKDHIVAGNVAEVDTLTVTGIPTVASNVTITLNGVAKTVAVDPAVHTTTALVAAAIRAAVYPGWATGGTGAIVIYTASSAGVRSIPTFGAGTTGVTAAFAVTAKGEDANYHRYFWNGTAWTDGGAYQAIELPEKSLNDIGDSLIALAKLLGVSIVRIADKKNFVGSGAYINATNGVIKTASSQPVDAYTGFIPVTAGNYYYYRGRVQGGGRLSMAFYSSNTEGSYISGIAGATEYYYDKLAKAPTGATYARFGYMIDPAYPFSVVDLGSKLISDLIAVDGTNAAAIAANATETGIVKKSVADELVYSSNSYAILGQFLKADGVFETHTSGFTTDYIPVKSDTIYLLKSRTSDARSFVLYDASYNFIAGYPGSSYGYTWRSQGEGAFLFHSGAAKFIRVSSDSSTALVTLVRSVFATEAYTKSKAAIDANLLKLNQSFGYDIYTNVLISNSVMGSQGYITATGGTATGFSGDKYTDYIAIVPGQKYGWTAYFSDARCIAMYDANKVLIRTISGTAAGNPSYYEFVAGGNEYFFRGSAYGKPNPPKLERVPYTLKDKIIKLEADLLAATPNAAVDYEYNAPAYIFASDNDSSGFYSRDYVQHLYPDSLLRAKLDMSLDDARAVNVQSHVKNVATKENVAMTHVLGGNGYKDKTFAYNLVKTKASNAKNKAIRYLAIGDSMTANNIAQTDGVLRGGGCYNAIVKELAMMDNIDMGDNSIKVTLLGTADRTDNPPATYKGQSISIRNCAEGRGSWCTVNYLRHMLHTITSGSTTTSFAGVDAWDSLGLGRKIAIDGTYDEGSAYETYTGSNAQKLLIAQTPHGKYHWDYTANLWAWLDAKYADVSGAYTGSTEQKALIDTKMNYLMDNPSNPFFDKAVAKATGDYAFSLTKYLSRYKTLADDGVTRLVVGSTAGTHVSDATAYDVCTPTHITLEVGENDRWHFGRVMTAQLTADDNLKIMNAIAAEYPAIKSGFITTRMMGPMFPEKWVDVADVSPMSVGSNEFKYDMNKIVQTALGTLASQTTKYFIPTYFTHSLTSFSSTRKDIDLETGKEVSVGGTDINHPGIQCYWSMAYQILAWIYYTL